MCSRKISVLKNSEKFTGKHLRQSYFLNKVCNFAFCEFCKIFKNTFLIEHVWTTAPA